jgi:carbon storage regulator
MLKLTRKIGQQVLINNGSIQVKVLGIQGNIVRIGFIAPKDIDIDREEIYLQKKIDAHHHNEAL